MRPVLMRHVQADKGSYKAWCNSSPYRHNPWHYHPECEVTRVVKGSGTLYIGDRMIDYAEDDIIFIGPNLPHEWRSDYASDRDTYSSSHAVHFNHNLFGQGFFDLEEVSQLNNLFKKSDRGLKIYCTETKSQVSSKLAEVLDCSGILKICKLLEILHAISNCSEMDSLSSAGYSNTFDFSQVGRLNRIYDFVARNFRDRILLEEVAALVNMTKTSFCRYFKKRTHKSFTTYLNEVRIGYACKLLLEGEMSIAAVAFDAGFGNISNFNRTFKRLKEMTPSEFVLKFGGQEVMGA